jgi:hypothetical protein
MRNPVGSGFGASIEHMFRYDGTHSIQILGISFGSKVLPKVYGVVTLKFAVFNATWPFIVRRKFE